MRLARIACVALAACLLLGCDSRHALAAGAGLAGLSFMVGSWSNADGSTEEYWIEPRGGLMLGLHRDVRPDGKAFFEYLRIEETGSGLTYFASPRGRPATPFVLKETGENRVVFENPEHDFPQRIGYWLGPEGALHARVEGVIGGKQRVEEWRWERSDP